MHAEDEQSLLNEVCKIISNEAGYRLVWVGYAENDEAKTIRPVAWAGFDNGYISKVKLSWSADTERGRGPGGESIRSGKIVYMQDFMTDLRMTPWRESALQRGYHSVIGLPLKDENANVFGVLLIYSTEINAFSTDELKLLEELSGDLAFGIMVLRARSERKLVAEELRLINERFSLATNAARLGVWDWNLHKNELIWDDQMYALYGIKREDFNGAYEAWLKGVHPDDRAASDEISRQARLGEREYDTEFRVITSRLMGK
jgi:GAF domain-containing protein